MKFTICYTSKSSKKLTNVDVDALFNATLENNNSKNITGILLYADGHFLQVLEGEKEVIQSLFYDTIYSDDRHSELIVIMEKETPTPFFNKYSSKFRILKTEEEFKKLKDYMDSHKVTLDSDKFNRLLTPFLNVINF